MHGSSGWIIRALPFFMQYAIGLFVVLIGKG
jgi:hypothetical protein